MYLVVLLCSNRLYVAYFQVEWMLLANLFIHSWSHFQFSGLYLDFCSLLFALYSAKKCMWFSLDCIDGSGSLGHWATILCTSTFWLLKYIGLLNWRMNTKKKYLPGCTRYIILRANNVLWLLIFLLLFYIHSCWFLHELL